MRKRGPQEISTKTPLEVTPEEKVEAVQELAQLRSVYDPMQREMERLEKEWGTNPDEQRKAAIVVEATKLRPSLETLSQEIKGLKSKIGSEGGRPTYIEGQGELFEEATPEAQLKRPIFAAYETTNVVEPHMNIDSY
jgi:predicted nuclease with TOPRIM domain